jgi:hypothetical protein
MADGEAARLFHIGGSKKVYLGTGLDLLPHQTRRAEFRRRDRIGAAGKPRRRSVNAAVRLPAPATCKLSADTDSVRAKSRLKPARYPRIARAAARLRDLTIFINRSANPYSLAIFLRI